MHVVRRNLTFANVMSVLALFVALTGTAYALGTGSVRSIHVKDNNLQGRDIKDGTIKGQDVANSRLSGADIGDQTLGTADLDLITRNAIRGINARVNGADLSLSSTYGVGGMAVTRPMVSPIGVYCIGTLPFTPVDIQATLDSDDSGSTDNVAVTTDVAGAGCTGADAAVQVMNDSGNPANASFYIHFWSDVSESV